MGIIPLVYFLMNFKKLWRHAPSWHLTYSFLITIIQTILGIGFGMRNWWTMVCWAIGATFIMSIITWQLAKGKWLKYPMTFIGLALTLAMIIAYATVLDWQYNMDFANIPNHIFNIVVAILFFFDLALNSTKDDLLDEPAFWYFSGILVFNSIVVFRDIQPNTIVQESYQMVQASAYLLMCITFTVGLYKWKNQGQF